MLLSMGLEGVSANAAWEELVSEGYLDFRLEAESSETHKTDLIVVIAAIIAITANSIKIGEFVHGWFQKRKAADPTFKVTLELPDGSRLVLENATPEAIERAFRALPVREK